MAQTTPIACPNCGVQVLKLVPTPSSPYIPFVFVNAIPDPTGHAVETGVGTGRCLKLDRSDAGGADIYKAHHLTCTG